MSAILVANSAQLVVTVAYYLYNSVLTSMLAEAEYSSHGVDRKPLRVTWPAKNSQQRSTYWLSVPYQYGVPIMVLFAILHWLVSLSLSYIRMIPYDLNNQPVYENMTSSLRVTGLPMIFALFTWCIMMSILVALSLRKLKSPMPLAASCSAAISAACHPPKEDCPLTAALGEVMWGETGPPPDWDSDQYSDDNGHCTFTSLDAAQPSSTKSHA